MLVVDANVLLHATNRRSAAHRSAATWLNATLSRGEPVAFAWTVLLAFLRLGTRPGIFPTPLLHPQALDVIQAWIERPNCLVIEPTSRHFAVLRGLVEAAGTAGNLTTDAHLAALAIEHGAQIVTFDRDFQRFAGLRSHLLT